MARRAQVKVTTDHEEIRRWAEERGAQPARVRGTGGNGDVGILRLEFPGAPGAKDEDLEPISWDDWFREFDERGLALVYEETTATGQKSNFNKIISRETAEAREQGDTKASRRSARGTSTRKRAAAAGAAASRQKSATSSSRKSSSGTRAASSRKKTTKAASGTRSAGRKSQSRGTASAKQSSSRTKPSAKSASNVRSISSGRGSARADRTASARGREGGRSNRRAA